MTRRSIDPLDRAGDIAKALQTGILLTTKAEGRVNTMVIGWGTVGTIWGKPVFVAYVREDRYTRELLDANPEFTVNIPDGRLDRETMKICGVKSGRELDKLSAAQLTPADPQVISVPGIRELPLTLECRVIYRDKPLEEREDVHQRFRAVSMDEHVCYYGEIVAAYVIED